MKPNAEHLRLAPHLRRAIDEMVALAFADRPTNDEQQSRAHVISEMVATALHLANDRLTMGELRLIRQSLREMRAAFTMFDRFRSLRKVAIFGSARTPRDHPDYIAALDFSRALAARGWMAITGAGDGIMKAGHEGPTREASFGLSIRLPFETNANEVIAGDDKLLSFRYFFTRKLMFVSHSDAVAVFPGGFGTMDEIFEVLTLVQTGKSPLVPIVLVEGSDPEGKPLGYWKRWEFGVVENLLAQGWIGKEDPGLYEFASSPADAVQRILRFYHRYHSSRYVGDDLVIRLKRPLSHAQVDELDREFRPLVKTGRIEQVGEVEGESEHPGLPRLRFHFAKRGFGMLRRMVDRINGFPEA